MFTKTLTAIRGATLLFGLTAAMAQAQDAKNAAPADATIAQADAAAANPFKFSGTVAIVSDYRLRGISQTNNNIAIQPSVTLSHESGLFAGVAGSNVSYGGAGLEIDLSAGYARQFGTAKASGAVFYYAYPGVPNFSFMELVGNVSNRFGPANVGFTAKYAPKQDNIGGRDSLYTVVDADVTIPSTPLSLVGSFGIEDGALGNAKRDWKLGINANYDRFTFGAAYVDATRANRGKLSDATVVVSAAANF